MKTAFFLILAFAILININCRMPAPIVALRRAPENEDQTEITTEDQSPPSFRGAALSDPHHDGEIAHPDIQLDNPTGEDEEAEEPSSVLKIDVEEDYQSVVVTVTKSQTVHESQVIVVNFSPDNLDGGNSDNSVRAINAHRDY